MRVRMSDAPQLRFANTSALRYFEDDLNEETDRNQLRPIESLRKAPHAVDALSSDRVSSRLSSWVRGARVRSAL